MMNKISIVQFLKIILVIGLLIQVLALIKLQLINGNLYREYAINNYVKKSRIEANRGEIFDRNGLPIAENYPAINLSVIPGFITNKDSLKHFLSTCNSITPEQFDTFIQDTRYRKFQENIILDNLNKTQVAKFAESFNYFPELSFSINNTRRYHYANHFSGYIGRINRQEYENLKNNNYHFNSYLGKTGIEKQYEKMLKGIDGVKLNLVDAKGRNLSLFENISNQKDHIFKPPVDGMDINLTIDNKIQEFVDNSFPKGMRGSAIVMNYESGEILAYVSRPEFDQNIFMSRIPITMWDSIRADTTKPFLDRVSKAVYPPGSVFKVITSSFCLEEKIIDRWSNLTPCTGGLQIGDKFVKCWNHYGHGALNTIDALKVSCDVFYYDLSFRINMDEFCYYVKDSMLSEKTGIDIPDEAKGFFPTSNWYRDTYGPFTSLRGHMVNLSIGQGEMFMTPLQICALYAGIANDGLWKKPHLLKQASREDSLVTFADIEANTEIKLPLSANNLSIIQEGLRKVVTAKDGTAHLIHKKNRNIYGKTGSAEHRQGRETHAWFAGYDTDTKIAVTVFGQEAGGGSSFSTPIAGKIFDFYYSYIGYDDVEN